MSEELYVGTLRAVFKAPDEATALMIADQVKVNGEKDLDEEEGDSLDVMQVTSHSLELAPDETLTILRRARNLLIKTRTRQGYDVGKELHEFIYMLQHRYEDQPGYELAGYQYDYLDIAQQVLQGGNPID